LGNSPTYFKKQSFFGHTATFWRKKSITPFKTTELTLVCDRKFWILRNPACSNLSLPNYRFAYSNSFRLTFASFVLTIIPRNLDNTHRFFLVSTINPWFESWLRRRSLNRKLIFSRSALAWIFWLFWVRNDWIWLVWDRSLKWVTLYFLGKIFWNCHGKKTRENLMGIFIFKNN